MTTTKQRTALEKSVENGGNITQVMRDSGYSKSTVNNPSNLTKSKGYKQMLNELGLNESLVVKNLISDIRAKPENRLGELKLATDILGLRKKILIVEEDKPLISEQQKEHARNVSRFLDEYLKAKTRGWKTLTINLEDLL